MKAKQDQYTASRLEGYIRAVTEKYPDAWKILADFWMRKGKNGFPNWPGWCFVPLSASSAIISRETNISDPPPLDKLADISIIGGLGAWRLTKGIYRFHPDIFNAVWDTPLEGKMPVELLYRLPQWCVYIEAPGKEVIGKAIHGFFAFLEYDLETGHAELRFLIDLCEGRLVPLVLHLSSENLVECIDHTLAYTRKQLEKVGMCMESGLSVAKKFCPFNSFDVNGFQPLISSMLYLCSENAEVRNPRNASETPGKPAPKRTKKGTRLFPAGAVTFWELGYRTGEEIRRLRQGEGRSQREGTHGSPSPHIRKAHWHSFWTGPRKGPRKLILRWLLPIAVGVRQEE